MSEDDVGSVVDDDDDDDLLERISFSSISPLFSLSLTHETYYLIKNLGIHFEKETRVLHIALILNFNMMFYEISYDYQTKYTVKDFPSLEFCLIVMKLTHTSQCRPFSIHKFEHLLLT